MDEQCFPKIKISISEINSYIEKNAGNLTAKDKEMLNTIFELSDTYDDTKKTQGKDSFLNFQEIEAFYKNLETRALTFKGSVQTIINSIKEGVSVRIKTEASNNELTSKMYKKWSGIFKNSNLKEDFYKKLDDVIDTLNIDIPDSAWDRTKYATKKEQVMDEVIAIFAGEAQLNSRTQNGIYYGLFQLAKPGLIDLKAWAKKHPEVPGMKNIDQNLRIESFKNVSGTDQLDYLVAYIGKCKEYSKIKSNESITPGQLWAMIKYPFKGRQTNLVEEKGDSIKNVFKNSNIPRGNNIED